MSALVFLIPLSILLAVVALIVFFWAVDHGQFDDLETPALVPLADAPDGPDEHAQETPR